MKINAFCVRALNLKAKIIIKKQRKIQPTKSSFSELSATVS